MEITNKTLAMFLVAAIVVSLAGTIISLNKLGRISTTGFATSDTGTASLYVNSTTEIFFAVDAVNWGEGYVNVTAGAPLFCTLDSETLVSTGCVRFTANDVGLVLENDGNTYPSISLKATQNGTTMFTDASANLSYRVINNESNSCTSPAPAAYTAVNVTGGVGTVVCPALEYLTANDTIRVNVLVNFTNIATTGAKSTTFTATAS